MAGSKFAAALFTLSAALSSCSFINFSSDRDVANVAVDLSETAFYDVDFSAAETVVLHLSGLEGKTLILAKTNTGGYPAAASETGSAALSEPAGYSDSSRSAPPVRAVSDRPPRRPHPLAAAEADGAARAGAARSAASRETAAAVPYGATLAEGALPVNTEAQFWVDYYPNGTNIPQFDTITATLARVTDHAYIWVANKSADDGSPTSSFDPNADLDESKIDLLADAFEAVVFPAATAIHGFERGGGEVGDGGIDGDQHISILVYDIDFDAATSAQGGYVAGYFWSKDDAEADTGYYPSNGREIFYLDAWALEMYPYTIVSTLAHEYQHMINYNMVAYVGRAGASTWLNEFRSLATEDLLAPAFEAFSDENASEYSTEYDFFEDGPGYWAFYFNAFHRSAGLETWSSTLYDYAFASVFASYLLRAYGGTAFMTDTLENADSGMSASTAFASAVAAAAGRSANTDGTAPAAGAALSIEDFYADILAPFALALWGRGSDGGAGKSPLTRSDAKAAPYQASARSLNAFALLDAGNGDSVFPACIAIGATSAIKPRSLAFHTDQALIGLDRDSVDLTVGRPTNGDIGYRLIVIE